MKEKLLNAIMNTIEERAKTKDEIEAIVYSIFDVLYELLNYNLYRELFDEVQTKVDELYDVYVF